MFYIRKTLIKPNVFCHPCSWTNIKAISVQDFLTARLLSKHFLARGWILNGGWLIICPGWDRPLMTRVCYPAPVKVTEGLRLPSWYPLSACTSSCELLLPVYSYHCLGCLIQVSFSKIKLSLKEWDGRCSSSMRRWTALSMTMNSSNWYLQTTYFLYVLGIK